jgi:hypothetical protein
MSTLPIRKQQAPRLSLTPSARWHLGWLKQGPNSWQALLIYSALAALLGRHTLAHMATGCACSEISDAWEVTWPFAWFPHALTHGLNPWYTHAMWNPPGLNAAGITSIPLPAMVLAPVTWLWGALVASNVANLGAPVVTAWATYHLCRYVSKDRAAALVGGATLGFGTYELLQMSAAHIVVTIVIAPQFAALAVLRYLDGNIGRKRLIAELTVCFVVQLFSSSEIFFTMTAFGVALLLIGYALGSPEIRTRLRSLVIPLVIAYAVTAVLSADYLYWILKSPKYAIGIGSSFSTDLLDYFIPTTKTWIGGSGFHSAYALFDVGAENGAYLGVPLILITVRWICTHWQLRVARFLTAAICLSILWTFGPTLHVAGQPTISMPYRLLSGLPLFNMVLDSRIAVYTGLLAAVILSLWLADRRSPGGGRWKPLLKWIVALAAAAFVLPNFVDINPGYNSTRPTPTFFATNMYRSYLKPGANVFPIEWGFYSPSLMWQAQDGIYYNLASGYFTPTPLKTWLGDGTTTTVNDLWYNTPRRGDGAGLRSILIRRHVDDVVVTETGMGTWKKALRGAGLRNPIHVGEIYLYKGPWR